MNRVRIAVILIGTIGTLALLAPALAPYDPTAQPNLTTGTNQPPSLEHPLGTDLYSRDLLSRVLYGARISLAIAVIAVGLAMTIGTAVGLVAGYAGGWLDTLLMRFVDAGLAIPRIFLLLLVVALWNGLSVPALVLLLGCTGWLETSRIVRAEAQSVRGREYVAAARALGVGPVRILTRHVLPNVAAPVIVAATLGIGQVILIEAGLSFLGFGVPQPTPSWGNIISDGQAFLTTAPWVAGSAGLAIVVTVLAFSMLGDALHERLSGGGR